MNDLIPSEFYLGQNFPNPFKEKTTIKYCIAHKTRVRITIYNSDGEEIEKLLDEEKKPGTYEIDFFATKCHALQSRDLLEGSYFYRLEASDYKSEKKMKIIK